MRPLVPRTRPRTPWSRRGGPRCRPDAVVIDGGMDVAVANPAATVAVVVLDAGLAAQDPPPTAVGDAAKLLDVDMDELAGSASLVTTDYATGRAIHPGQAVQPETHKYAMHRRGGDTELGADADRA